MHLYDIPPGETRPHRDFGLTILGRAPAGYPATATPDPFSTACFAADFTARKAAYFEYVLRNPAPPNFKAPYHELARLAAGGQPHEGILLGACDYVERRKDCADFVLHSLLRLLYQFNVNPRLSPHLYERAYGVVTGFKYWPDEPGSDSMCTWTENHQILFAAAGFLAGQFLPEERFTNSGRSGQVLSERARPRILRWLDLRERTGFSEWLSNVYYDEDLTALLALLDFSADDEIRERSARVINVILLDLALNSFQGVFGSTHGRSYAISKMDAGQEATSAAAKLLFGLGSFSSADSMSAACLALSPRFELPQPIFEIANDVERPDMENRQQMGIRLAEAERWGLGFEDFEDGMVHLSLEAYAHPRTVELTFRMFDAWNWWENLYFAPFATRRRLIGWLRRTRLMPLLARILERDLCRNTREAVNIYTYRTPDYLLSSAQDYRKGFGGDQQSIWQATLGPGAVCFTTHPAKRAGDSPNYWTGSGSLPRVGQFRNVLVAVYRVSTAPGLYHTNRLRYTHAWLPRAAFDEVVEQAGWIFTRKGGGYLALRPKNGYRWVAQATGGAEDEVVSEGVRNVWLCELGRTAVDGPFDRFVEQISRAEVRFTSLGVQYHSPSQGLVQFGWRGPLRVDGKAVSIAGYPRYANPFVNAPFGALVQEWKFSRARAAAIIVKDQAVLLIHRLREGRNYYVFPGGGVEPGESFEAACRREVEEETGLAVTSLELAFELDNEGNRERYFLATVGEGRPQLGGPEKALDSEKDRYLLEQIPIERLKEINLLPEEARNRCAAMLGAP